MNQNEENLSFSPINGAHAIAEMAVFLQFSPEFSLSTINKLASLESELKNALPKSNKVQKVEFKIEGANSTSNVNEKLVGIELQSIGTDGSINWMLRTSENSISVHCLNYSTWEKVSEEILKYLNTTFKYLEGSESFISNIGLMYIDRFICNVSSESANLQDLFNKNTDLVFNGAFKAENKLWHSHIGWYEALTSHQCLNQLKTSSSYANIKGEKKLVVTVDHNAMIARENFESDLVGYSGCAENSLKLESFINSLHGMNKKVLKKLLTDQMSNRINL